MFKGNYNQGIIYIAHFQKCCSQLKCIKPKQVLLYRIPVKFSCRLGFTAYSLTSIKWHLRRYLDTFHFRKDNVMRLKNTQREMMRSTQQAIYLKNAHSISAGSQVSRRVRTLKCKSQCAIAVLFSLYSPSALMKVDTKAFSKATLIIEIVFIS